MDLKKVKDWFLLKVTELVRVNVGPMAWGGPSPPPLLPRPCYPCQPHAHHTHPTPPPRTQHALPPALPPTLLHSRSSPSPLLPCPKALAPPLSPRMKPAPPHRCPASKATPLRRHPSLQVVAATPPLQRHFFFPDHALTCVTMSATHPSASPFSDASSLWAHRFAR